MRHLLRVGVALPSQLVAAVLLVPLLLISLLLLPHHAAARAGGDHVCGEAAQDAIQALERLVVDQQLLIRELAGETAPGKPGKPGGKESRPTTSLRHEEMVANAHFSLLRSFVADKCNATGEEGGPEDGDGPASFPLRVRLPTAPAQDEQHTIVQEQLRERREESLPENVRVICPYSQAVLALDTQNGTSVASACSVEPSLSSRNLLIIAVDGQIARFQDPLLRAQSLDAMQAIVDELGGNFTSLSFTLDIPDWQDTFHSLLTLIKYARVADITVLGTEMTGSGSLHDGIFDNFAPTIQHISISISTYGSGQSNDARLSLGPNIFRGLSRLVSLSLASNRLSVLHEGAFSALTRLESLFLNDNHIRSLQADTFSSMKSLRGLRLQDNRITAIPPGSFEGLTNLTRLLAQNNDITELPLGLFSQATQMQNLFLGGNQLTAIHPDTFHGLSALTALRLDRNSISSLPQGLLKDATNLVQLHLHENAITSLPVDAFAQMSALSELFLYENAVTALPTRLFRDATSLRTLYLYKNRIDRIDTALLTTQSRLDRLWINDNRITHVGDGAFSSLTAVTMILLHGNRLERLPPNLFKRLIFLKELRLSDNRITFLHPGMFKDQELINLEVLYLQRNDLRSLPSDVFGSLPRLLALWLYDNGLTSLHPALFGGLSRLNVLFLQNNELTAIQDGTFAELRRLRQVWLSGNRLTYLDPGVFADKEFLLDVALSDNLDLELPMATIAQASSSLQSCDLSYLKSVDFGGRALLQTTFDRLMVLFLDHSRLLGGVTEFFRAQRSSRLRDLSIGGFGLDETVLGLDDICSVLSSNDVTLSITDSHYTEFNGCGDAEAITSLRLVNNPRLRSVVAGAHNLLDLSGNPQLSHLVADDAIPILDISGTNLPFSPNHCITLGSLALFGSRLQHPSFQANARQALSNCFTYGSVFDFSHNLWLSDLSLITAILPHRVILGTSELDRDDFYHDTRTLAVFRESVPLMILEGTAIDCRVEFELVDLLISVRTQAAYSIVCDCAANHRQSGNVCVSTALSSGAIAGISFGVLSLFCILMAPVMLRWYRRKQREKYILLQEKELQEHLLGEELEALKKGWQVELSDLALVAKVDEGAFGEVWRAEWDGVAVAVKFLKTASLGFVDKFMLDDLDKEVDFLRRTRHAHLVRFFGTGIDNHGSPFLVLEFVELGSLKHILHEVGLEATLQAYLSEREKLDSSSSSMSRLSSAQDARLTTTDATDVASSSSASGVSVADLKLRLVCDVATGMAFLHSLNVMHRDLKSGNVLVTRRLVAKITDFGSMSGRLSSLTPENDANIGSSSRQYHHNSTSTTTSVGGEHGLQQEDLQYSPDTLNRTIGVTMTAGVGTPLYMAPEVLDAGGKRLTLKIDVFSFGVLMWEVHTCRVPDLIEQELGEDYRGSIIQALFQLYAAGKRLSYHVDVDALETHNNQTREDRSQEPMHTSDNISWFEELSLACMSYSPSERPSFPSILHKLTANIT